MRSAKQPAKSQSTWTSRQDKWLRAISHGSQRSSAAVGLRSEKTASGRDCVSSSRNTVRDDLALPRSPNAPLHGVVRSPSSLIPKDGSLVNESRTPCLLLPCS